MLAYKTGRFAIVEKNGVMDRGVFAITLLLLGFGIVLVYSSSWAVAQVKFGGSDFFLARQAVRAMLAVVCFVAFINIDYHALGEIARPIFIVAVIMLVLVLIMPHGHAIKGARRWIQLGPLAFQASDYARLALIVMLAKRLDEQGGDITQWKKLIGMLGIIAVICGLIFIEPNFSTALIVALIGLSLIFIAGANMWHLVGLGLACIPVAAIAMLSAQYRLKRVMAYLHKSESSNAIGYQAYQALIGLGSGGIFGKGLGQGEQKYFYLPEPHTDFVFSILGEEIGFAGLLLVLGAFVFILVRGVHIAQRAPDMFGRLLAFGVTFMVALYVIVHAAVNTALIPTTGVTLPLLSYGGMSMLFTAASMGILLNISSQTVRQIPATHKRAANIKKVR